MNLIKVVCGVVTNSENRILITQRGDKINKYKWEFPGGKVNKEENINDSIKRELKEELGIDIIPRDVIFQNTFNGLKLIFISCTHNKGKILLSEHLDYKWVNQNELKNFDFLEGDMEFIKQFEK